MNVVIVTGASKGLGLSISRKLIQEKYYVVGIGRTLSKGFDDLDKKLSRFNPTPRRDPVDLIKIRCRICGKEEEVSPALVAEADRYKCNRCSISSG